MRAPQCRSFRRHAQSGRSDEQALPRRSRSRRLTVTSKSPKQPPSSPITSTANPPIRRRLHPLRAAHPDSKTPDPSLHRPVRSESPRVRRFNRRIALVLYRARVRGRHHSQPDALRAAGDRAQGDELRRAVGQKPRPRARAEPVVRRRDRVCICVVRISRFAATSWSGRGQLGLGRSIRQHRVQCHAGRRRIRHGVKLARCLGNSDPRLFRKWQRSFRRLEGRPARRLSQGRRDNRPRHAVHRAVHGLGNRLGDHAESQHDADCLRNARPRHGQSLRSGRRLSRAIAVPAQAGRLDGNVQTNQRLRPVGEPSSSSCRSSIRSPSCRRSHYCSASPSPAGSSPGRR